MIQHKYSLSCYQCVCLQVASMLANAILQETTRDGRVVSDELLAVSSELQPYCVHLPVRMSVKRLESCEEGTAQTGTARTSASCTPLSVLSTDVPANDRPRLCYVQEEQGHE
ncbi:hypothetical protein PR048_016906 [Dryococelus australis]|uniref:Uncharacterized protein n=1 Tax=Dryococelus australis TaxID=614101 RepID=A0ABQ9H837_9NEOP|nr:hypothetical protein PR048_016906 [Dryococelus australis]